MPETLLSPSAIKLFGRPFADLDSEVHNNRSR